MSRLQQCCRVCFVSHRRWARLQRPLALNVRHHASRNVRAMSVVMLSVALRKQRVGKAKERKRTAAEKRSDEDKFVGSVHETTACHRKRHSECPKDAEKCIRCRFAANIHAWKKAMPWLAEKPSYQGGFWRLGCDVCAWHRSQKVQEDHEGRRGCKVRSCAFARHDFCCSGKTSNIYKRLMAHACHDGHRAAVIASRKATCTPLGMKEVARDAARVAAIGDQVSSRDLEGQGMLRGRVPQIDEWLGAWAEGTETISFRKQQRLNKKKKAFREAVKTTICGRLGESRYASWQRFGASKSDWIFGAPLSSRCRWTTASNTRYFVIVATRLASHTYVMESSVSYVWTRRALTNLKKITR